MRNDAAAQDLQPVEDYNLSNAGSTTTTLWGNSQLADVCFSVHFIPTSMPSYVGLSGLAQAEVQQAVEAPRSAAAGILIKTRDGYSLVDQDDVSDGVDAEVGSHKASMHDTLSLYFNNQHCSVKQYLLHSQYLRLNSDYFSFILTKIVEAPDKTASKEDHVCRWEMRTEMCIEDSAAVEAVLASLHTQQMYGPETDSDLLLKIMKVANLWQFDATTAAASQALCKRVASFPVSAVCALPESLLLNSAFADVLAAAKAILLLSFDNARSVVDCPVLLDKFLGLPPAALQTLLQNPLMVTDAEATVLLLFSSWCGGHQGRSCSAETLQKLNSHIRYSRVSVGFLTEMCGHLHAPLLTSQQLLELWHYKEISKYGFVDISKIVTLDNPSDWYLPDRPRCLFHLSTTLNLAVTRHDLKHMLATIGDDESDSLRSSQAVYSAGFMWTLCFGVRGGDLWCTVRVEGVSALGPPMQQVALAHGIVSNISMSIKQERQKRFTLVDLCTVCLTSEGYGNCVCGCHTISQGSFPASLHMEWWEPYMLDGCVHISADIQDISDNVRKDNES